MQSPNSSLLIFKLELQCEEWGVRVVVGIQQAMSIQVSPTSTIHRVMWCFHVISDDIFKTE